MTDQSAGGEVIEIVGPVAESIASWHRVFCGRNGADPRDLLRNAAVDLWQTLEIDRTVHPELHPIKRQAVVDALWEMAQSAGIEADDAQLIFAQSFKAKPPHEPTEPRDRPKGQPPSINWRNLVLTAAELQRKQFPAISYVIPGLIPEGLSILAGRPKVGKSWLALDVGIAVAAERLCLGEHKAISGDVLYCALEDNPRRLQRRIDKILSPFTTQWPQRLTLATAWQRLDKGGVEDIKQWADSVATPRLCILDTLAGVRPIRTRDGYTEDYESLAALHRMASERGLAVLVLHHTRKMEAEDPIDTISGTLGLAGCADTALVIGRTAAGNNALHSRARYRGSRARRHLRQAFLPLDNPG